MTTALNSATPIPPTPADLSRVTRWANLVKPFNRSNARVIDRVALTTIMTDLHLILNAVEAVLVSAEAMEKLIGDHRVKATVHRA